jgi:hypothetical protein
MQKMKILGRFLFTSSVVFGLSTVANWNEWNQYWNGTLRRVQTVDFNMLSHTLPTKLSAVLANKNYQELQRTIDSNYGLFGIIVTDCKKVDSLCREQKITFASNGRKDWKILPESEDLSNHPFDLLRTPAPLITEKSYENPNANEQIFTKGSNEGIIIGRVYYVRGTAPAFISDYISWLSNVWSTKGSHGFYALKTGSLIGIGLTFWLSIEFLLYKKRVGQQQAIQEKEKLQKELSKEINRNSKLLIEHKSIITQQKEGRNHLECSIKTYQQQVEKLSSEIDQLTSLQSQQQSKLQAITQLLIVRQDELNVAHTNGNFTQEQLLEKENEITQLQQQMDGLEYQKQSIIRQRLLLKQNLGNTCQRLSEAERQIHNLEIKINTLSSERDRALREIDEFKQKLAAANDVSRLTLILRAAQLETDRMEELYNENIQSTKSSHEETKKTNLDLGNERDELQLRVWELEGQLKLFKGTDKQPERLVTDSLTFTTLESIIGGSNAQHEILANDLRTSLAVENTIDLSSITIALIGGDNYTRREVIQRLSAIYSLKEIREVPPKWERRANNSSVKITIRDCDLIAVLTGRTRHNLTNIISGLREKGNFQGKIVYINTTGASGIFRDISNHLDQLSVQHNLN